MSRMLSRTCSLGDYIVKNSSSVLKDYEIHREKHKFGYSVLIGTVRNSREWVKIYKSVFREETGRHRFFALIKAFRQGIILANNIFISMEDNEYYLYTIEPYYCNSEDKYTKLSKLLQKDDFDHFRKQKLFQNLVSTVKDLHNSGVAHLTLCPKNIWVESELIIRLRPFEINTDHHEAAKGSRLSSKCWYMAPEQLLRAPMKNLGEDSYFMTEGSIETCERQDIHHNTMASDLWSLGCIFAELFATVTPLFQSINNKDLRSIFFKVLGFPSRQEIYYMDAIAYKECFEKHQKEEQDSPLIQELTKSLSKGEIQILTSLLIFNPNKRPTAQILLELSFFRAYSTHKKQKSYADYIMQAFESASKNEIQIESKEEGSGMKSKSERVPTENTTQRPKVCVESVLKTPSRLTKSREATEYSPLNTDDWWNLDLIEDCEVPKKVEKPMPVENSKEELSNSSKLLLSYIEGSTHNQSRSISPLVTNQRETLKSMRSTSIHSQQQVMSQNEPRVSLWSSECNENRRFSQIFSYSGVSKRLFESASKKNLMRPSPSEFIQLKQIDQNSEKTIFFSEAKKDLSMNQAGFTLGRVNTQKSPSPASSLLQSKPGGSKAKLIIDVGMIKNLQQMEKGSFCCKITFRTRKSLGSRTKDTIELFSCFVPFRSDSANLSFKGETILDSNSFCKLYNEELLEVQVFFKRLPQKDKMDDTTTLYGVCRISLLQALPNLPILFSKGGPIRGMRCWYDLSSPKNENKIVGQINLCASVEFEERQKSNKSEQKSPVQRRVNWYEKNEEDRSKKQLRKEVIMESLRFKSQY